MNIFDSIILGAVEGITEFLPVSSTGHLILTSKILGLATTDFLKTFEIAIQSGAILAVVWLYRHIFFKWNPEVWKRLFVAFIPTGILGLVLHKYIKALLGSEATVLSALFLGGIFLVLFDLFHKEKESALSDISTISYRTCATIGLFQSVAMIPGVSRSAATIVGGLLLGISRKTIVEFSFLLAVPTMAAATGYDLLKSAGEFSQADFSLLAVGFVVAFLTAIIGIKGFLKIIGDRTFVFFGAYRILIAVAFYFFFF
jgi:undecaprenyl-diphosphatase